MSKICKKKVHRNYKKNLPWDFKKCPRSLHFTLLENSGNLLIGHLNINSIKNIIYVLSYIIGNKTNVKVDQQ